MRKQFIFPLLAVLLLSWPGWAHDNGRAPPETIRTEVSHPSVARYSSAKSTVIAGSGSQTIVLKNPTFQELRDFILRDPTSRNKFVLNRYECRHFATEVDNNAETEGLRCAFVLLCFERGQHAVVAFDTTDKGLVYIEPQTDARIHPEVGDKYGRKEIKEILIAW